MNGFSAIFFECFGKGFFVLIIMLSKHDRSFCSCFINFSINFSEFPVVETKYVCVVASNVEVCPPVSTDVFVVVCLYAN